MIPVSPVINHILCYGTVTSFWSKEIEYMPFYTVFKCSALPLRPSSTLYFISLLRLLKALFIIYSK